MNFDLVQLIHSYIYLSMVPVVGPQPSPTLGVELRGFLLIFCIIVQAIFNGEN